jgi:hypothetical protein
MDRILCNFMCTFVTAQIPCLLLWHTLDQCQTCAGGSIKEKPCITLSDLIVAVDHFLIFFVFKKNTMKNFLKEEKIKKVKRCRNFQ